MKFKILFLLPFLLVFRPVSAEELFEGDVYLQGTNKGTLLFTHKNSRQVQGDKLILRHIYTGTDGKLSALEEVVYRNGKLDSYTVEMPDSKCGCKLERNEGRIVFSFTRGGEEKKESDYTRDIVMGPTLRDFIDNNWRSLVNGGTAYFNLPAMNLQKVARFQLSRDDASPYARKGVMVLKMKIANYFLRLFVDPVDLVMDMDTKRMIEIHGKSLLTRRVNGRLENPVVDIYYRYK